jgi:hypothetical protein
MMAKNNDVASLFLVVIARISENIRTDSKEKRTQKEIKMMFTRIFLFFLFQYARWKESSNGDELVYFLPPLVAVAADLVTLPVAAAFFSTSLITPTATV